jgi:arylformamidase
MFIDITRTIGLDTLTFIGDEESKISEISSFKNGDNWNILRIDMITHTGTHLDAPLHKFKKGKDLNKFGINDFIIDCLVVEIKSKKSVSLDEVVKYQVPERGAVLFKTFNSNLNRKKFKENYIYVDSEVAEYLKDRKVKLVGVDYLSIDKYNSPSYPVHNVLLGNDILILEDVNLKEVKPGKYKLYCLPIRINNADGAPCRAFLEVGK